MIKNLVIILTLIIGTGCASTPFGRGKTGKKMYQIVRNLERKRHTTNQIINFQFKKKGWDIKWGDFLLERGWEISKDKCVENWPCYIYKVN